ncbi:MAG: caspase family protein [Paludisphaera borealis]|uniref:caspase family protein n=1 Tax=Paludisphaera borealis TaxID=1387353 RepID=UPI002851AC22|nr:caspase family protein [Paludisphaera borealis]MDR3620686.1 caspase family protein [Paludisphaera borealis]
MDNLQLLLNPIPTSLDANLAALKARGNLKPATRDQILTTFINLAEGALAGGERLFFFYMGHGLMSRISFTSEDAIVPSDFLDGVRKAISVSSILRFFQAIPFPEQFCVLDCCRNMSISEMDLDRAPPRMPDPTRPAPDQFVFYATGPGLVALDARGMLTDNLLDGLKGAGRAKSWSRQQKQYEVSTARLFDYITSRFQALQPVVPGAAGGAQNQTPRLGGEHSQDRTLATLPESAVSPVSLNINLNPQQANSAIDLLLMGDRVNKRVPGTQALLPIPLKPRIYTLTVESTPQWDPGDGTWELEVYEDMAFPVSMTLAATPQSPAPPPPIPTPTPADPAPAPPPPIPTPTPAEAISTHAAAMPTHAAAAPATPIPTPTEASTGELAILAEDPLAALALFEEDGTPVMYGDRPCRGNGSLKVPNLPVGVYLATMKTPEGPVAKRLVRVEKGKSTTITIQPPETAVGGLIRRVIDRVGFDVNKDGVVDLSARVKSVAAPAISTVLELSRCATKYNQKWRDAGNRLRDVLNPSSQRDTTTHGHEARSGEDFQVMIAAEVMPRPLEETLEKLRALGQILLVSQDEVDFYLRQLRWQLWPMDAAPEESRPLEPSATPGVAMAATPTTPGSYWFRVDSKDRRRNVCFALTILPGYDLNLIFHQVESGRIFVSQFMEDDRPGQDANPLKTRRLDMAQRFLMRGDLGQGSSTLEALLDDADELNPIAGSLGGHVLVKQGRIDRAGAIGERLVQLHPTLPDGYVLSALDLSTKGRERESEEAYRKAMDLGFPVVAENTMRLGFGVAQMRIEHPRAELLNRVVERLHPGLLWTAWMADPDWPKRAT